MINTIEVSKTSDDQVMRHIAFTTLVLLLALLINCQGDPIDELAAEEIFADDFYHLDGSSYYNDTITEIPGSTSGTAYMMMPFREDHYKKVMIHIEDLLGNAKCTFPESFAITPSYINGQAFECCVSVQVTSAYAYIVVPATPSTRWIIIEGW